VKFLKELVSFQNSTLSKFSTIFSLVHYPPILGSNGLLQTIDVSTNLLQGSTPIPMNICKGNNLVKFILFNNIFTNTLPLSLNNCTSLTRVQIKNNKLNGPIPQTLTKLPELTFLDLTNNNFKGKIPQKLWNLQYLNISGNSFESELPSNIWNSSFIFQNNRSNSQFHWLPKYLADRITRKFNQRKEHRWLWKTNSVEPQ